MAVDAALPDTLKGDPAATLKKKGNSDNKNEIKDLKKKKDKKDNEEKIKHDKAKKTEVGTVKREEEANGRIEENKAAKGKEKKLDMKKEIKEMEEIKEMKTKKDNKEKNDFAIKPHSNGKVKKMEVDSESEEEDEEEEVFTPVKDEEEDSEDEEDKKVVKKLKIDNGTESLQYVNQAVTEYWKANGLSSVALEEGLKLVNPLKARILEEKWKRHFHEDMRLLVEGSKTSQELLVSLREAHKGMEI